MSQDYPSPDVVPCMFCGSDAKKESEGLETDYYRCHVCPRSFGITWDGSKSWWQKDLVLRIKLFNNSEFIENPLPLEILLKNNSDKPVLLMRPGDGSSVKWRPPFTSTIVRAADGTEIKPDADHLQGRCGVMNPLTDRDFFTLKPGEEKDVTGWFGFPYFTQPGTYLLQVVYENYPNRRYSPRLIESKPGLLDKMHTTQEVRLESNVVTISLIGSR